MMKDQLLDLAEVTVIIGAGILLAGLCYQAVRIWLQLERAMRKCRRAIRKRRMDVEARRAERRLIRADYWATKMTPAAGTVEAKRLVS